jgi:hypothetical protein
MRCQCVQAFQTSLAIVVACIAIQILSRELDIFESPLIGKQGVLNLQPPEKALI